MLWMIVHFAPQLINEVCASPTQIPIQRENSWSSMEEVHPNEWSCTLWSGAAVIYEIEPNVGCPTSSACKVIFDAIKHYESRTCVRFKARSGEKDYVEISHDPNKVGCFATMGRDGGTQFLFLGSKCLSRKVVLHEMGHTLGLPDEVSRPDRDDFVTLDFDNIEPASLKSYKKEEPPFPIVLEEPFDYQSIMMYGLYASAKNKFSPTIVAKKKGKLSSFRLRFHLSQGDIQKISKLYGCQGTNQDPIFPFDVSCSFDENMCGFKNFGDAHWIPTKSGASDQKSSDRHLHIDFKNAEYATARLASVNFHALSPLDKTRGPKGCVSFSYYISPDGPASLTLSLMKLDSPHQLHRSHLLPLWAKFKPVAQWTYTAVPVDVVTPFALVFRAQFMEGTTKGTIGVDNFKLSYSPCMTQTDTLKSKSSTFGYRQQKTVRKSAPTPSFFSMMSGRFTSFKE